MKKLGSASRATFVSPYLRRPLRPLDKVLSERADDADDAAAGVLGEAGDQAAAATWGLPRKPAAVAD